VRRKENDERKRKNEMKRRNEEKNAMTRTRSEKEGK
jgi:hypothetical protein